MQTSTYLFYSSMPQASGQKARGMETRDTIIDILKTGGMKTVELSLAVWAHRQGINLEERGVWTATDSERQEIEKTERSVRPLLLKLEEEGIVEISPRPQYFKWVRLREVKV